MNANIFPWKSASMGACHKNYSACLVCAAWLCWSTLAKCNLLSLFIPRQEIYEELRMVAHLAPSAFLLFSASYPLSMEYCPKDLGRWKVVALWSPFLSAPYLHDSPSEQATSTRRHKQNSPTGVISLLLQTCIAKIGQFETFHIRGGFLVRKSFQQVLDYRLNGKSISLM